MEVGKYTFRQEGEGGECLAATSHTDCARSDDYEKTEPGEHADAALKSGKVKDEEQDESSWEWSSRAR